jgi:hypothetical protein
VPVALETMKYQGAILTYIKFDGVC